MQRKRVTIDCTVVSTEYCTVVLSSWTPRAPRAVSSVLAWSRVDQILTLHVTLLVLFVVVQLTFKFYVVVTRLRESIKRHAHRSDGPTGRFRRSKVASDAAAAHGRPSPMLHRMEQHRLETKQKLDYRRECLRQERQNLLQLAKCDNRRETNDTTSLVVSGVPGVSSRTVQTSAEDLRPRKGVLEQPPNVRRIRPSSDPLAGLLSPRHYPNDVQHPQAPPPPQRPTSLIDTLMSVPSAPLQSVVPHGPLAPPAKQLTPLAPRPHVATTKGSHGLVLARGAAPTFVLLSDGPFAPSTVAFKRPVTPLAKPIARALPSLTSRSHSRLNSQASLQSHEGASSLSSSSPPWRGCLLQLEDSPPPSETDEMTDDTSTSLFDRHMRDPHAPGKAVAKWLSAAAVTNAVLAGYAVGPPPSKSALVRGERQSPRLATPPHAHAHADPAAVLGAWWLPLVGKLPPRKPTDRRHVLGEALHPGTPGASAASPRSKRLQARLSSQGLSEEVRSCARRDLPHACTRALLV